MDSLEVCLQDQLLCSLPSARKTIRTIKELEATFEFRQISSNLDWGEAALINQFRMGLQNNVKDLLLILEDPISLNNAISKTECPRDPNAIKYRSLSTEEKERHHANNLCLYCREPGHMARNCFNKSNT
ncbi:6765_t:CDS:2 [Cetraspora pellucida]|uniref:6765_t:CDS:1 n=1 Tax=Cetraspora pellucida TaxID=1433469 RepID=A0A9N9GX15_9GLOM|nr:6765_t:CDS:2 [Cetraspora pellucida]